MKPTLLVLAAGMGSRYGGLKQVDPVGPGGETLLDYSIYDAVRAGYGKVVFVIRRDFAGVFKEKVGDKVSRVIETDYVFQEMEDATGGFQAPPERKKPWGTAHAVLAARKAIQEPFAVINADDFYGPSSFEIMGRYLLEHPQEGEYAMIGFRLENTLSENGTVSRGICEHDEEMFLTHIEEHTAIEKVPGGARSLLPGGTTREFKGTEVVSMNFWGFQPDVFEKTERLFRRFLAEKGRDPKAEFFIPLAIDWMIREGSARVRILPTEETWFGVTYPEDKETAKRGILDKIAVGVYPARLWP